MRMENIARVGIAQESSQVGLKPDLPPNPDTLEGQNLAGKPERAWETE